MGNYFSEYWALDAILLNSLGPNMLIAGSRKTGKKAYLMQNA